MYTRIYSLIYLYVRNRDSHAFGEGKDRLCWMFINPRLFLIIIAIETKAIRVPVPVAKVESQTELSSTSCVADSIFLLKTIRKEICFLESIRVSIITCTENSSDRSTRSTNCTLASRDCFLEVRAHIQRATFFTLPRPERTTSSIGRSRGNNK